MRPAPLILTAALLLATVAPGCLDGEPRLLVGFPTSMRDTGLVQALVDAHERDAGQRVLAVSGSTGELLSKAERGDLDLVIGHAPLRMQRFAAAHDVPTPEPFVVNDWLVVGPAGDPAQIKAALHDPDAFQRLARAMERGDATFVSRGDGSGTHEQELAQWQAAERSPDHGAYLVAGGGQAAMLRVAEERGAYALTDEGTWRTLRSNGATTQTTVLHTLAPSNLYLVLHVAPASMADEATAFARWLQDDAGIVVTSHQLDGRPLFRIPPEPT